VAVSARPDIDVKVRLVLLGALTLLSGYLRFTATSFGLPDKFRPDEELVVLRALDFTQDWNPHFAIYPAAQMYLDHAVLRGYAMLSGNDSDFRLSFSANRGTLAYLVARRTSAVLGTVTVPAIYLAALPLGPDAALASAAIMALSTLHVRESKFATTDSAAVFWLVLSLAMVMRMIRAGRGRDYLLAGFFAGVATATKYSAGAVLFAIIAGHLEGRVREGRSVRESITDPRIYLAGVTALIVFLGLSPYVILDWDQTVRDFAYQRQYFLNGVPNPLASYGWTWMLLHAAPDSYGYALMFLFLIVLAWAFLSQKPGTPTLLVFIAACVIPLLLSRWLFYRYLLFPLPGLALLAGAFLSDLVESAGHRLDSTSARASVFAGLALLLSPSALSDLELNNLLSRDDTRTIARKWIEANIPSGSSIAVTVPPDAMPYGKPQLSRNYRYVPMQSLDLLRRQGVGWVLSDSLPAIAYWSKGMSSGELVALEFGATEMLDIDPRTGSAARYDPADAYYAPIANISASERPGPRIRIWKLK